MQIKNIKYSQFHGADRYWSLEELRLEKINLLVGKNAAGKSKTLNVINGLSVLLCENTPLPFIDGCYDINIEKNNNEIYNYKLEFHNTSVADEQLFIGVDNKIKRDSDGKGIIISANGSEHSFEMPSKELKVNRRDNFNYPYLEDINHWATHVRMFQFSSDQGKQSLAMKDPTKKSSDYILKNTDAGVMIAFNKGVKDFPDVFKKKVIADFNSIGYDIEDITIGSLISANFQPIVQTENTVEIVGFRVKEKGISCLTDQIDMSSGMFRALSIIIHFNYYEFANIPGVVLIDDIGEGLDFERSTKLIELLISKVEKNDAMQLIMSTNDSFVMNSVDLKYWQIIEREGCNVKYYNHKNSEKSFSDYNFTGLNNFDFFTTGFFKEGFKEQK